MFIESEGFNGYYYDEEYINNHEDLREGDYFPSSRRKRKRSYSRRSFDLDRNYYHTNLFNAKTESFSIIRETEKAYLFFVDGKNFWCPKSLLKNSEKPLKEWLVWNGFSRKYLIEAPISDVSYHDVGSLTHSYLIDP